MHSCENCLHIAAYAYQDVHVSSPPPLSTPLGVQARNFFFFAIFCNFAVFRNFLQFFVLSLVLRSRSKLIIVIDYCYMKPHQSISM